MNISLLDCTLRDGSYINGGNFGEQNILSISQLLSCANVEMIELGWLQEGSFDKDSVFFSSPFDMEKYCLNRSECDCRYLAMADCRKYNLKNLKECSNSIDTIRLIYPYFQNKEFKQSAQIVLDKGYKLFIQAAYIMKYSKDELLKLAQFVNEISPEALFMVDTRGMMFEEDLENVFNILNSSLDDRISLGFHSHNSLQLSFSLAIKFLKLIEDKKRNAITDCSLSGLARGAGTLNSELIAPYLNKNYQKKYDVAKICFAADKFIKNINAPWGYNPAYSIAGYFGAHADIISYLLNKGLGYFEIYKIVSSLNLKNRCNAHYDLLDRKIEELC